MNDLHTARSLLWMGMLVSLLLILVTFPFSAVPLIADGTSFLDDLDSYDTGHWLKADGWCNEPESDKFDSCWKADHISHDHSMMTIELDDAACTGNCSNKPYTSGEYRTHEYYGYGCFEARFRPAAGSGLITSFFTYNGGDWDTPPGGNGEHNEIDIEILGKDTTQMQVNYFVNDLGERGEHKHMVSLGFDAASDLHNYAFKWTAAGIEWYVDGRMVYSVTDTVTPNATPAQGGPHKIMMNFWPAGDDLVAWAGPFTYTVPLYAEYDWIRYTAGDDCQPAGAGPSAPPGNLSANSVSCTKIDLSWTDYSTNESGFKVERSLDSATWAEIAAVPAHQAVSGALVTFSDSDSSLVCGTTCYYRVRAYNENGYSVYSNIDNTTTSPSYLYLPVVLMP